MTSQEKKTGDDNILRPGAFQRKTPQRQSVQAYVFRHVLTFKNIVISMGFATVLIFLASAVSPRMAFLILALSCVAGLVFVEMRSRRVWESKIIDQLQKMGGDYERLVRETARNRNDLAGLKKNLSAAGTLARSYGNLPGEAVEQRMLKALADQLAGIGMPVKEEGEGEDRFSAFNVGVAEKDAPLDARGMRTVGRRLTDAQVLEIVRAAVENDRVDLFMQPVVNLPQRKVRFYEMFSRIRIKPNVYLPAERYIEVAMKQDLVPVIDNLLLLRGLQMIRDTEEEHFNRAFFCNITSLTLNDPKFMGDLVEFISQNRTLAPRLVFEMGQQDLATMSAETLPVLDGLVRLGCRFSMDRVDSMSFDFSFLEARHVRFIKTDAAMILKEMKSYGGYHRMSRMKMDLDNNGIDLIVEKIESEKQLLDLLDIEIDYGQGFLFGKPDQAENI
ncbi:MAG: EAL domain-containing protein [Alphaproteobacteria bacterium]|nr:EAL domain-containing protein [Alphaproteobacteria bacterium]